METEKKQQKRNANFRDGFVPFSELSLSDGFLFGEVMQDEEMCRTVLEIILKRPIGRVVYVDKGAICFEDLEDFSDGLKETVAAFIDR